MPKKIDSFDVMFWIISPGFNNHNNSVHHRRDTKQYSNTDVCHANSILSLTKSIITIYLYNFTRILVFSNILAHGLAELEVKPE